MSTTVCLVSEDLGPHVEWQRELADHTGWVERTVMGCRVKTELSDEAAHMRATRFE
jgi:hypothetical protein